MSLLSLSLLLALVSLLPATTAQCDADSTFYFPPALSQTSQTLLNQNIVQVAAPGVLHVFPMMFNSQCSVTEIEFCYRYDNLNNRPVFTLYLFEGSNANQVSGSRVFSATPTPSPLKVCNNQLQRCCERQPVASDMFSVPSSFVFGVAQASGSSHSLLAFTAEAFPTTYNIHNVAVIGTNTELLSINSRVTRGLRVVRFIIDPDAMPTTTSTTSPSDTTSSQQPTPTEPSTTSQQPTPTGPSTSSQQPTPTGPSTESSTSTTQIAPSTSPSPSSPSSSPSAVPSGEGNGGAVAAGVIVSLLVVLGIGVAVTVVVVVLWKRKRSKSRGKSSLGPLSGNPGFDNRVYNTAGSSLVNKFSVGAVSAVPEEVHEYEAPAVLNLPQEYEAIQLQSTVPTHGRVNPYANTLNSRGGSFGTTSTMLTSMQASILDPEIIYEIPAREENSLYAQFRKIDIKHIPRSEIQLQDVIGSGQFGTVHRAVWKTQGGGEVAVAVKMLKNGSDEINKVKFLQEAAIMGQFTHPSVVKLHGVTIVGMPKMIILELLALGDLRRTIRELRPSDGNKVEDGLPHTLLSYCRQVASGMSYLAGKAFVHRDLAARNILVSEDGDIKIADFGMSRDLLEENYYVSHGGKIPVKWTAPEAIHYRKYSTASDVWSFGAVMYEIWSLGHKPFEGYTNPETVSIVDSGVRLPPPPGCPRALYALMIKCWHSVASERPDFPHIVQHLSITDTKLLKWAEEDRAATPAEAATLGAELRAAVDLYKELQNTYLNSENTKL